MKRRSSDRWTRPLNGEDMVALLIMWLAIFAALLVSIKLFDW